MQRRRRLSWTLRVTSGLSALALLSSAPLALANAAGADSFHWGGGAARLSLTTPWGIPTALEAPNTRTTYFGTILSKVVVYHEGTATTVGDAWLSGSLTAAKENTLGGWGTASMSMSAPASAISPAFSLTATGTFRRTQAWLQIDVNGTAAEGGNNEAAVRVSFDGAWRPTTGDGVVSEIYDAEAVGDVAVVFPGTVPPAPGPKGASAVALTGNSSYPSYPCPAPGPGQYPCSGSFTGELAGVLSGDDAAGLWAVELDSPISSAFTYFDPFDPGVPCALESGAGSVSLSIDQSGITGFWSNYVEVPVAVQGATLSFDYTWTRVGTVMAWSLSNVDMSLHTTGPHGWVQVLSSSASANAVTAFAPELTTDNATACEAGGSGPPLTAQLAGMANLNGVF